MKFLILVLISFLILHSCAKRNVTEIEFDSVSSGMGKIEFRKGSFEGISRIWYYNSYSAQHPKKVVFVLHGQGRQAKNELYPWTRFAEEESLLIVAPEFSDKELVSFNDQQVWAYNIGNVVGYSSISKSKDNWYFSSIEKLFQHLKNSNTNLIDQYILYGHSAGGQFVHRMALFSPDSSFDLAIAANSGWYTLPVTNQRFPYGLSHSPIENKAIDASFQKKLIVLLGKEDKPSEGGFRKTKEAMIQGSSRPNRGKYFFDTATKISTEREIPLNWKLKFVEGVGHDGYKMSLAAFPFIKETVHK